MKARCWGLLFSSHFLACGYRFDTFKNGREKGVTIGKVMKKKNDYKRLRMSRCNHPNCQFFTDN